MAFGSFERKTSSQPMAEINMVPLIDVVLVLLVIFIVTAPLLTNVNAFPAATVTTGVVTLQPSLLINGSQFFSATVGARSEPFGPPDWKYRVNTGGGPIGSMGPFTVQRKRRRPLPVDQQQEDAQPTADPWDQQFR
jgi:hypothetical protein